MFYLDGCVSEALKIDLAAKLRKQPYQHTLDNGFPDTLSLPRLRTTIGFGATDLDRNTTTAHWSNEDESWTVTQGISSFVVWTRQRGTGKTRTDFEVIPYPKSASRRSGMRPDAFKVWRPDPHGEPQELSRRRRQSD